MNCNNAETEWCSEKHRRRNINSLVSYEMLDIKEQLKKLGNLSFFRMGDRTFGKPSFPIMQRAEMY